MPLLLFALCVAAANPSRTAPPADDTVSLVHEVDLESGDSPLVAQESGDGINLSVQEGAQRVFRTAAYLKVNDQNKVQLHVPGHRPVTVGSMSDDGKNTVALCRGWIHESWCEATMRVDELRNTAVIQLVIPRRDGNMRAVFKQTK